MIGGLQACSLIDFPGQLAAVIFTQGCPLKCRYCHNPGLRSLSAPQALLSDELLCFLGSRRGKLSGVVVSGGEPTIHEDLPRLLEAIHSLGFPVKLDTNGMNPKVIRRLVEEQLVARVAVDVKVAPGYSSFWLCGVEKQAEMAMETLRYLVRAKIPCEARTTVVQKIHDGKQLNALARALAAAHVRLWRLQPVKNERVLDQSMTFVPPEGEILSQAVAVASSLGVEAVVASS